MYIRQDCFHFVGGETQARILKKRFFLIKKKIEGLTMVKAKVHALLIGKKNNCDDSFYIAKLTMYAQCFRTFVSHGAPSLHEKLLKFKQMEHK